MVERQVPKPIMFNEKVARFKYEGFKLGNLNEELSYELKEEEEETNAEG